LEGLQFEAESKLALAFRGNGVLSAIGGFPGMVQYGKLATSTQQLKDNDNSIPYLESLLPTHYSDRKDVSHSIVVHESRFWKHQVLSLPFCMIQ
jgi:hypothetical protein